MGRDIAPTTMGFGLRGQPLSFSARMEKHGHKSMTTTRELQSTMRDHIRRTIAFIQSARNFPRILQHWGCSKPVKLWRRVFMLACIER
jgi:hypothetical protein